MRHILLAFVLSLAAGCVGGITPPGDDGDDGDDDNPPPVSILGKMKYDNDVYPIMTAKCSASGCHMLGTALSTAFVTPTVTDAHFTVTSYSSVVGNFTETGAPILTKITQSVHYATYTIPEQDLIKGWLAQEVIDRQQPVDPNLPPPMETPGQVTARLISEWSGCLALTDFTDLRFGEVWANKGSGEGNCEQCHQECAAGMCAMDDNMRMYEIVSGTATATSFYMLMFFRPNVIDLQNAMMVPNLEQFYRVGANESPFTEHPSFDPDDQTANLGVSPAAQTQELYNRTLARLQAGQCGPPILPP